MVALQVLMMGALVLTASATVGQADPAKDMAEIERRAGADAALQHALRRLNQMAGQWTEQQENPQMMFMQMLGLNSHELNGGLPFDYADAARRQTAEIRAQMIAQVLASDLDGDWQISRDEMLVGLRGQQGRNSADMFLLGDKDRNDLLDTAELRAVVEDMAQRRGGRSMERGTSAARLIDFDNDGSLTAAEVDRAMAALAR